MSLLPSRIPALILAAIAVSAMISAEPWVAAGEAVPMIHVSDLYRPHNDPDDHWDLACVYALAFQSRAELLGVLIDYPQPGRAHDPDVLAVAQLNYLTGKSVPVMVGSPRFHDASAADTPAGEADLRGVRALLDWMRRAPRPVVINVLGSCRDVALAGRLEPRLFAEKCRGIYLNAGSGTRDPQKAAVLEWNVHLDPAAYRAVFDLPCPIYWMPCFEEVPARPGEDFQVAEYGTFYRFRQGEILPDVSPHVRNFFAYMFLHGSLIRDKDPSFVPRPDWLRFLTAQPDPSLIAQIAAMDRNMWCTAGFFHAVGLTVTQDGNIVPASESADPVFTFDRITVSCSAQGVTEWQEAEETAAGPPRFIFHVRNVSRYPTAMTAAMRSLLRDLP
ncbi:MAG: hypothetical protein GYA33_10510, partial [Thermogutta sp.]|nr:hypothetical protein [Thermogutta sp.]